MTPTAQLLAVAIALAAGFAADLLAIGEERGTDDVLALAVVLGLWAYRKRELLSVGQLVLGLLALLGLACSGAPAPAPSRWFPRGRPRRLRRDLQCGGTAARPTRRPAGGGG